MNQVRSFLAQHSLDEYADAVIEFGADTPKRLQMLTVCANALVVKLSVHVMQFGVLRY